MKRVRISAQNAKHKKEEKSHSASPHKTDTRDREKHHHITAKKQYVKMGRDQTNKKEEMNYKL